jgi:hypothetical protein
MKNLRMLVLGLSLGMALPAAAHDKNALNPRDVVHCMQARMKASQTESYREAFKICKQQLDPRDGNDGRALNAANMPETPKR